MAEFVGFLIALGVAGLLLLVIAAPILLVIGLLVMLIKLGICIILLPIRILGWGIGISVAAIGLLFKGIFLTGAAAVLVIFGLLPFIPLLLFGLLIYFVTRTHRATVA